MVTCNIEHKIKNFSNIVHHTKEGVQISPVHFERSYFSLGISVHFSKKFKKIFSCVYIWNVIIFVITDIQFNKIKTLKVISILIRVIQMVFTNLYILYNENLCASDNVNWPIFCLSILQNKLPSNKIVMNLNKIHFSVATIWIRFAWIEIFESLF